MIDLFCDYIFDHILILFPKLIFVLSLGEWKLKGGGFVISPVCKIKIQNAVIDTFFTFETFFSMIAFLQAFVPVHQASTFRVDAFCILW